jgi:hypothetical protein
VDIDPFPCQQRCCPIGITGRRSLIQHGKDTVAMLETVSRLSATIAGLTQPGHRWRANRTRHFEVYDLIVRSVHLAQTGNGFPYG